MSTFTYNRKLPICHPFSCVVRRPSCVVRRASCVVRKLLKFSSSSWRRKIGFYRTLAGIILWGRGFKVVQMVPVALMGALGEGPQGPKPCKFQTSSSPDPDVEQSSSLVCRYLLRWRIKVVHDSSKVGPIGPPRGGNMLGGGGSM